MVAESVKLALIVYLVAAVIAFLVAWMIKLIFAVINLKTRMRRQEDPRLSKSALAYQQADTKKEP
jgi:phosphotransferase system  glucose/maltose/N-acetylglucosamine-specific IIC component